MKKDYYPVIGEIILLPCNTIIPVSCGNVSAFDLQKLTDSILQYGLLEPLQVKMLSSQEFEVVSGVKRFLAAQNAGMTSVPCILLNGDAIPASVYRLIVNTCRSDTHYLDRAEQLLSLYNDSFTVPDLAQALGTTVQQVSDSLKLASLSEDVKAAVKEYHIPFEIAVLLSEEPENKQSSILQKYLAQMPTTSTFKDIQRVEYRKNRHGKIVIFKDINVFSNTIDKAVHTMVSSGIPASVVKNESQKDITYQITISKETGDTQECLHFG